MVADKNTHKGNLQRMSSARFRLHNDDDIGERKSNSAVLPRRVQSEQDTFAEIEMEERMELRNELAYPFGFFSPPSPSSSSSSEDDDVDDVSHISFSMD